MEVYIKLITIKNIKLLQNLLCLSENYSETWPKCNATALVMGHIVVFSLLLKAERYERVTEVSIKNRGSRIRFINCDRHTSMRWQETKRSKTHMQTSCIVISTFLNFKLFWNKRLKNKIHEIIIFSLYFVIVDVQ